MKQGKIFIVLDGMGCAYHFTKKQDPKTDREWFEEVLKRKYPRIWDRFVKGDNVAPSDAELIEYKNKDCELDPIIDLGLMPLLELNYQVIWSPSGYKNVSKIVMQKLYSINKNYSIFSYIRDNIISIAKYDDGSKKNWKVWYGALKNYKNKPIGFVIEDSKKNLEAALIAVNKLSSIKPIGLLVIKGSEESDKGKKPICNNEGYFEGSLLIFAEAINNGFFYPG